MSSVISNEFFFAHVCSSNFATPLLHQEVIQNGDFGRAKFTILFDLFAELLRAFVSGRVFGLCLVEFDDLLEPLTSLHRGSLSTVELS